MCQVRNLVSISTSFICAVTIRSHPQAWVPFLIPAGTAILLFIRRVAREIHH